MADTEVVINNLSREETEIVAARLLEKLVRGATVTGKNFNEALRLANRLEVFGQEARKLG
jgi:hypothetical protein